MTAPEWLARLLRPSFCHRCDKPVRRSHYRRCPCLAVDLGDIAAAAIRLEAAKAERKRIAAVIEPAKLRWIADWFDADDALKARLCTLLNEAGAWYVDALGQGHGAGANNEFQDDLRAWADLLEQT